VLDHVHKKAPRIISFMPRTFIHGVLILFCIAIIAPFAIQLAEGDVSYVINHSLIESMGTMVRKHSTKHPTSPVNARYRLSFSMLVDPSATSQLEWAVEETLSVVFQPLLDTFSVFADWEIDSQVLYHSRLVKESHEISASELEHFFAANDWNPNSFSKTSDDEKSLHFMLYVPATDGLKVENLSHSFQIPEWGGVVIFPKSVKGKDYLSLPELKPAFEIFKYQLCEFLMLDRCQLLPENIIHQRDNYLLSSLDTLQALSRLIIEMPHMKVPLTVQIGVDESLFAIQAALSSEEDGIAFAKRAFYLAEKAFFDPALLPMLYFPPEHFVAVYMPLLFPTLLPVLSGLFVSTKQIFSK